jgi:hypothetical protein
MEKMASGEWRVEKNSEWRMANSEWRMANGKDGEWRKTANSE